jgi:hypothetical protein
MTKNLTFSSCADMQAASQCIDDAAIGTGDAACAESHLSMAVPVSPFVDATIGLGPALLDAQDRK